jgi:KUP system potassium uptake protein
MAGDADTTRGANDPSRHDRPSPPEARKRRVHETPDVLLALGALGVVYGDIGTNPLFAMREAFTAHPIAITEPNVLGFLSLAFWSLILVISVKYISFVMRANNDGEGGILALVALIEKDGPEDRRRHRLVLLGVFGAALLFGDGMITPAISVLAAVEGTSVAAPSLHAIVIPAAVGILIGLFLLQRRGTATVGRLFGPIMLVWFATIAVLGASHIVDRPGVFVAINPLYAATFFTHNGFQGFLVLGAVILVVVGGEALYADMGHFGRRPIAMGWYAVVLPSLVLVYFGQGALLLEHPSAIANPFYEMAPEWALIPLVVLATLATVIASQALISGSYSLMQQAVQLGFAPRVRIVHTSSEIVGQVYVQSITWVLATGCVALVLGFRHSERLAGAYGLAVAGTMLTTTILFTVVVRERFHWPTRVVVPASTLFLVVDLAFFTATLAKIPHGGWVPISIGIVVFTLMTTWRTGKRIVRQRTVRRGVPLDRFVHDLHRHPLMRPAGTGVYLYATPDIVPPVLLANLRLNHALHEQVLVLSVLFERRPYVPPATRAETTERGEGFCEVVLRFGFQEIPDVERAMRDHVAMKLGIDPATATYFVGREALRVTERPGMARWRERLYTIMSRNAVDAAMYFELPQQQVLELGTVVEL